MNKEDIVNELVGKYSKVMFRQEKGDTYKDTVFKAGVQAAFDYILKNPDALK